MYDFISGLFVRATQEAFIIEANGIGFKILVSSNQLKRAPQSGSPIKIFTSFIVREDAQILFGFEQQKERDFFEELLHINGIGPKTALAIIGNVQFKELSTAILQKDIRPLCRVPGIGKKTAERLLLDLKDRASLIADLAVDGGDHAYFTDAVNALTHLGYSPYTAQKAVQQALEKKTFSDLASLISASLQYTQ